MAAIHTAQKRSANRTSDFNLPSSAGITLMHDQLACAMTDCEARVRVAMNSALNVPDSTTKLTEDGAPVRFPDGVHGETQSQAKVGNALVVSDGDPSGAVVLKPNTAHGV